MKRSEVHFGQRLFIKSLHHTAYDFGMERELEELKETYITVHEFSNYDRATLAD